MKVRISDANDPHDSRPPSGLAVLALVEVSGAKEAERRHHRIRAMWLDRLCLEAPTDWAELDKSDDWDEGPDEELYWPSGWYEATACGDPMLTPLGDDERVLAWMELPAFDIPINRQGETA